MKKNQFYIAITAIISLLLVGCTIEAEANQIVRHNYSCSTSNQLIIVNHIEYKCSSINKKLVWRAIRKVETLTQASPTPSIKQSIKISFTPWQEKFTVKEMIDASQINFWNWINKNKSSQRFVINNIIYDPLIPVDIVSDISAANKFISESFGQYLPKTVTTIIGSSHVKALDMLIKNNHNSLIKYPIESGYLCSIPNTQNAVQACASENGLFYIFNMPNRNNFLVSNAIGAHEYFHTVQFNLIKTHDFHSIMPAWFIEGSAEFVGYSYASSKLGGYFINRPSMMSSSVKNKATSLNLKNYYYNHLHENYYPYDIGRAAIEYLAASIGFEKVIEIIIECGNGKNFEDSFLAASGISINDFYNKFETVLKNNELIPKF